jgi:hypothetical protein
MTSDNNIKPMTLEEEQALQVEIDRLYIEKLLAPCFRKRDLKKWLKLYLDADLTDTTIDENSTSNAMDMVWSVYHAMLTGDSSKIQHVVAVARGGAKTLCSSIIEILAMLHFGRNVVHCAAEKHQSSTALGYFDKCIMDNKKIQGFIGTNNSVTRRFVNLPKTKYRPSSQCELKVITASLTGVNGKRGQLMICDELDLVKPEVLAEMAYIPVPHFGLPAISVFLSSRQSASGPIQKKVEDAADPAKEITLHKWSIVDLMKKCPTEIYKPELPKQVRYINNYSLTMVDEIDYNGLAPASQSEYTQYTLNDGCLKCPIATVCRGRAINQTSDNQFLRSITDVKSVMINNGTPSSIIARMLNLKPESNGLVFNLFERRKHYRPIEEVWEFAFGEKPACSVNKLDLCVALRNADWRIHNGVDFGLNDPATSVQIAYQKSTGKLIVINVENAVGYDHESWLQFVKTNVYDIYGFDSVYPDLAYPVAIRKARALHLPARDFVKPKVEPGVSFIRQKLFNPITQKSSFMIVADPKNDFIVSEFESWSYMKSQSGYMLGQFDKDGNNHALDALRYACVPFVEAGSGGRMVTAVNQTSEFNRALNNGQNNQQAQQDLDRVMEHYRQNYGIDLLQRTPTPTEVEEEKKKGSGRKVRFFF